jgi:RHS repeat-associated protein
LGTWDTTAAICATREVSWSPSFYRGEQYDSDLALYYLRARYYNPNTGRFLSDHSNKLY